MTDIRSPERSVDVYRWLLVGALTLVMTGFYGAYLSFGVLLKPILLEFGWTRTTVSGAMSLSSGITGLSGVISGRLTDRYGAKLLIGIGAILGISGYLFMTRMNSVWQLYIYFGIIVGISFSVCWTPVTATVSRFFFKNRVLALGITTSGITVGQMFLPPLLTFFINSNGWRFAYIISAIIIFLSAVPAVIILGKNYWEPGNIGPQYKKRTNTKNENAAESGRQYTWKVLEAVQTLPFWILLLTGFVTAAGFFFIAVHIVAYATDMGIEANRAAVIFTFMGGANILGKFLTPLIVIKIGSKKTLAFLLALQALALFVLIGADGLWMFFLLITIFGFGFGGSSPLRMTMIAEFFGLKSIGAMIGTIEIAWSLGAISGPVMAGFVFDVSGRYDTAFLTGGLIVLIGSVSACFLKKPLEKGENFNHTPEG